MCKENCENCNCNEATETKNVEREYKEHYKFFQNRECEYFPCHKTNDIDNFNCLFCYCPLYMLQDKCGGNFVKNYDVKDCSKCLVPHAKGSYERIMAKMKDVLDKGSDF